MTPKSRPSSCVIFTPLEKAAAFKRRSLPLKADSGLKPPSAHTVSPVRDKSLNGVRERSSLTGFTQVLFLSLSVIGLDQLTKSLARTFLSEAGSLPVLKNVFHLTLFYNTGAAFGLLKGGTAFFTFISILCIVAILLFLSPAPYLRRMFSIDVANGWVRLALGLVLGGATGNLIDRLRFGAVVDFLDFRIWPVFNLADSAITIGGLVLFYKILKDSGTKPK